MAKPNKKEEIVTIRRFNWSCIWGYPFMIIIMFVLFLISLVPIWGTCVCDYAFANLVTNKYNRFKDVFFNDVKYRIKETEKITKLEKV